MQEVATEWVPFLLTRLLQAGFLLVILAASIESLRAAWHRRSERVNLVPERPSVGSTVYAPEGVTKADRVRGDLQRELAADDDKKRRARELRDAQQAGEAAQRDLELREQLERARASQQEQQETEAEKRAQETRAKKLENLRAREQEILHRKAAPLDPPGALVGVERELERARAGERTLRRQQDAAFQASLAADRAREAELRSIAEERERIEKGVAALAERKRQEKRAWEEHKCQLRASLPAEPPIGTAGRIALSVRLPKDETVRRGWSSSCTLADVYNWVDSLEGMGFSSHDYRLVTTFPRRILERESGMVLLSEHDLSPSAALVVEIAN